MNNREVRLGFFAIIVLAISIWGYYYLKGRNLLSRTQVFYAEYQDIADLMVSSPVKIHGFQVGTVIQIALDKKTMKKVIVTMDVQKDISVPADAVAVIEPVGVMGGSFISLLFDKPCSGQDCAQSGDVLQSSSSSLLGKMLGGSEVKGYVTNLKEGLSDVLMRLDSMSADPNANDLVGQSLNDLRRFLHNIRVTTDQLAIMVSNLNVQLGGVMKDFQAVSSNLKAHNEDIGQMLSNANQITGSIAQADLGKTIAGSQKTLEGIDKTVADLSAVALDLKLLLQEVNSGQGTLAKIIHDPNMYNNLNKASRNIDLLLQDIRLNPKRYINVSLIGGRQKSYVLPEQDPALNRE